MHPSTNGQHKHRLEPYTEDTSPTIKVPPLSPHSSYPPRIANSFWRVMGEMALTFGMFLYVCCAVLAFIYFKDSWYRDEFSRIAVMEGVAILVTGIGVGIGGHSLWLKRHRG